MWEGNFAAMKRPREDEDGARWWIKFGEDDPEVQQVAIKGLKARTTASASETNWKDFSFVHDKIRNRLNLNSAKIKIAARSHYRFLKQFEKNSIKNQQMKYEAAMSYSAPEDSEVDNDSSSDSSESNSNDGASRRNCRKRKANEIECW